MPEAAARNDLLNPRVQKHRRLRCAVEVEVVADLVSERCRSHDLSASGMFIDAAQQYARDMVVELSFELDDVPYATRARIIHVKPLVGFGVEFLDFSPAQRAKILQYVHRERASREAERLLLLR